MMNQYFAAKIHKKIQKHLEFQQNILFKLYFFSVYFNFSLQITILMNISTQKFGFDCRRIINLHCISAIYADRDTTKVQDTRF
ncbi:hypothetical protein DXA05_25070 [Bacteroides sp. AM54-2NS]|nr:hypothetical protein DXA05_25070 [Bacteroides sp. AM54-2NS]